MGEFVLAIPGDPETLTGGYIYDARVATELRARGHRVAILRLPDGFPMASEPAIGEALRLLGAASRSAALIVDGLAFGALPAAGLKALGRELIALIHHPLALETGLDRQTAERLRASEREALRCASAIITTSEATRALLVADHGATAEHILVAPPGVDAAPRAACAGAPPVILTVATITPRKNHARLAGALARLADIDWRWRIVGAADRDLACSAELRRLIEALGIGGRVEFAGELGAAELAAAYASADLFALPSRFEGYGMAWAEALARGLPVVAGDDAAAAALVPAAAGAHVGSVDALAAALRRLIADPEARRAAADAAWAHAATLPRWAQTANVFERLLEQPDASARVENFEAGWLDLRERADHAAWAHAPLARVRTVFGSRPTVSVADLGAGSGSTLRALSEHLGPRQSWTLIDHDPALLAHARRRLSDWADGAADAEGGLLLRKGEREITVAFEAHDLAATPLPASAASADLVTASAFFDLVGAEWLDRFSGLLAEAGRPLYARLTYDGRNAFLPAHPLDDAVNAAFNRHQGTDKGFGFALGSAAGAALDGRMAGAGYSVDLGPSVWRLGPDDEALTRKLLAGIAQAASEAPDPPHGLADWLAFRVAAIPRGSVEVWHLDGLFLPPQ
ncbi:glycosyltransferase [Hansschlegelia plantiphila]|uniref:Glycosyltransferase n=1 Tax=Hansschlegelia plantiphila TaxID=374655 RepID=A0A9W6MUQ1_9HYPH|nr:glycosyltransferase [Hansschlegelia plantiphila]GLK67123.1 hypothetical protein GCM10008179_07610 [Hansschlegelia plantiphila]